MRTTILQISQEFALKKNLDLADVLILDYMLTFFGSGFAVQYRETISGHEFRRANVYYWLSPNKLLSDLPILKIQKRMLTRRLEKLEEKNIINRIVKNNKIFINFPNPMEFM